MKKNSKLLIILTSCIIIILLLISKVIIPCIRMYEQKQLIKNAKVIVNLNENLNVKFNSDTKLSSLIKDLNGTIITDKDLKTNEIGTQKVTFEYENEDNIKIPYTIEYNVVDETPPVVWLSSSYTINVGTEPDFYKDILCGDDLDNNPECIIEGEYNTEKSGSYQLNFKATDNSGNITNIPFTLFVKDPKKTTNNSNSTTITKPSRTNFQDVINYYKTPTTKIGIDVSGWQGDIDFEKVKSSGVEFAILKVGGTFGIEGEYYLDSKFKQNIEGFNRVGIPVGIYFFSYAKSKENAIRDAEWVYDQIKEYKIDLPVVYDWENWSFYNEFNLSFNNLTKNAEAFLDTLSDKGYKGMLYGSKNYIDKIWLKQKYPIWVAHYTTDKSISYEEYAYWQICDNGQIDGINGNVDIDIMYVKE